MSQSVLQYERIKSFILAGIDDGDFESGERIPSENQLAQRFSVSRMTVNRAIKELEFDGVVDRVQGKGTFVAAPRSLKSVLQIQGIDQEIRERGGVYSCRTISHRATRVTGKLAEQMRMAVGEKVFLSLILHSENDEPLQLEQRWVRPSAFPEYLDQVFDSQTPHDYLMSQAPFTRGEHTIEACLPDSKIKKSLQLSDVEACLLIHRKTWVGDQLASYVKLFHSGERFQLTTSMSRGSY